MDEDNEVEAVALLRVPAWDAPEELDVRFLDDGVLVFLPLSFDSDPHALLEELVDAVGDVAAHHDDDRGIFFFPDFAEPDEATTYEAVIAAVGDAGTWIALDAPTIDPAALFGGGGGAEAMMEQVLESMGISDPKAFMHALQSGDPDAMKLAQIQLHGRLEDAARGAPEPTKDETKDDDPSKKSGDR